MKKNTPLFITLFTLLLFSASLTKYILKILSHPDFWYKFDLQAYYNAGLDVIAGRDVYLTGHTYFDFVYTPFAAILFSYFVPMTLEITKYVMLGMSAFATIGAVWISWGLLGYPRTQNRLALTLFTSAIILWSQPVQETLFFGQINLLLLGIIMLGFSKRNNSLWNGIGVGITAGIKLTPLIFIIYLFLTRRIQAAIVAILTFLATIMMGFLLLPKSSIEYWGGLYLNTERVGSLLLSGSQSLHATFSRYLGNSDASNLYWVLSDIGIGIFGVSLAVYAGRRGKDLFGILICAVTGLLISPFSWTHHWVWLILMMPISIHLALIKKNHFWWIGVIFFCAVLWRGRDFSVPGFPQIQDNFYVIFGMLFLLMSAGYLFFPKKIKWSLH